MTFFSPNAKLSAVYISSSALTSLDLASMKPMMSCHNPAMHHQPLKSFVTEQVGPDPHLTNIDEEKEETKLKKYT